LGAGKTWGCVSPKDASGISGTETFLGLVAQEKKRGIKSKRDLQGESSYGKTHMLNKGPIASSDLVLSNVQGLRKPKKKTPPNQKKNADPPMEEKTELYGLTHNLNSKGGLSSEKGGKGND